MREEHQKVRSDRLASEAGGRQRNVNYTTVLPPVVSGASWMIGRGMVWSFRCGYQRVGSTNPTHKRVSSRQYGHRGQRIPKKRRNRSTVCYTLHMPEDGPKPRRRFLPRFSLRTLLLFVLLFASGYGLRYRWEPWVLERTFDGAAEWIQAVDCSPDNRHLVIAGKGEVANVHDADSGAVVASLVGHEGDIATVAYSPDGNQIVTSGFDKTVRLWNAVTGEQLAVFSGHAEQVWSAKFSGDGRYVISSAEDGTTRIWDIADGKEVLTIAEYGLSSFISPDRQRLVLHNANDDRSSLYDCSTGTKVGVIQGQAEGRGATVFSPDGSRLVTAGADGVSRVYQAQDGRQLFELRIHKGKVISATFSPDGTRIITAGSDSNVRVWDSKNGAPCVSLAGHSAEVWAVGWSWDGNRVVTGSKDRTARVWDAETGMAFAVLSGHTGTVYHAFFSPDGRRIITSSQDGSVKEWLRNRPEGAVGVLYLPEFWLTLIFGAGLLWNLVRDFRTLRKAAA